MSSTVVPGTGPSSAPHAARFGDYLRIARFDHASKHVFIVPGIVLAVLLRGVPIEGGEATLALHVLTGFVAAVFVASANYVINEWLDRDFDRFHPEKSQRAAVQREMNPRLVIAEYVLFLGIGLGLASLVNTSFLVASVLLAVSGVTYNVRPIRSKDRTYADVLSESVNNPLRLIMGWTMVDAFSLPPASLILAFWFGGAFLMNSKRLAEYRDIVASDGVEVLHRYRRSFKFYTENRLAVANLVYALLCAFFTAIFLIKYRIEYVLLFPCIAGLFAVYYALALQPNSVARKPERLYGTKPVLFMSALTGAVFAVTTVVDLPVLEVLTSQRFIEIGSAAR